MFIIVGNYGKFSSFDSQEYVLSIPAEFPSISKWILKSLWVHRDLEQKYVQSIFRYGAKLQDDNKVGLNQWNIVVYQIW